MRKLKLFLSGTIFLNCQKFKIISIFRLFDADQEEIELLSPGNEFNQNRIKDDIKMLLRPDKLYKQMCEYTYIFQKYLNQLETISDLLGVGKP